MNERSIEDAACDMALPVLKMSKGNLIQWVKSQSIMGSNKPNTQAEGDLSFDQIEKKYLGLIEDLYNFAVEATVTCLQLA